MYIPSGYYDSIDGLEGELLKAALNDIITGHTEYPYTDDETDVWDLLKIIDEDPDNPDNVLLFYSDLSWYKDCQDTTTPPDFCEMEVEGEMETIEWNREHVWSKSRGDFEIKEGTTTVLAMGAHTDLHHLVPEERTMNSIKNNRMFEDCNDGDDTAVEHVGYGNYTCNEWDFEPRDEVKGDVARMLFYMAIRYEGEEGDMVDLELVNNPDSDRLSKLPLYGDLDDLLRWHEEDPISEREILRNQKIYTYQNNRNPFIDMPDLVPLIWGRPEDYIN
jgi:endonuclease I